MEFDSYEEADSRRFECPMCGKHKYKIIRDGEKPNEKFTLKRCRQETCDVHCHGHEIPLVDHQSPDHVGMVSLR